MAKIFELGYGVKPVEVVHGGDRIMVIQTDPDLRWRGKLSLTVEALRALLNEQTGAPSFDPMDEYHLIYRTKRLAATRIDAVYVDTDNKHAHWLVELRDLKTREQFTFTSAEWNEMIDRSADLLKLLEL